MPTPGDFFGNLLDTISGQTAKELTQAQIDAAKEVALAQAQSEATKSSPEALAERGKIILGVVGALSLAAVIITILWIKFK